MTNKLQLFPGDQYSPVLNKSLERYYNGAYKTLSYFINAKLLAKDRFHSRKASLQDVYDDIMLDPFLLAVCRNRKFNAIANKWQIVDDEGFKLDEETKLIKRSWFTKVLSMALDARFYGYTLIELGNLVKGEIKSVQSISRQHVSPEKRMIMIRTTDVTGISIDDKAYRDNYILVDGDEGLGLLASVAPNALMKRYGLSSWVDHAEAFALPFLHLKTLMSDPDHVSKMEEDLRNAGRERMMITEGDDELTAVTSGSDAHQIYEQLIERNNKEIATGILGNTLSTIEGSSYSQSRVHLLAEEQIALADMEFLENFANDELIPRLINLGYPLDGGKFAFDTSRESTHQERINSLTLLLQHYDVDPATVKDLLGIDVEPKSTIAHV